MDTSNQNQPQVQQTILVVGKQKSVGTAFLLAFLFGPLGLLYASVTGGIVMLILGLILGIVTLGLGLVLVWVGSIIWAVTTASNANQNAAKGLNINTNFGGQQPQTYQQPQPLQKPAVQAISEQIVEPEPGPVIQPTTLMTQPTTSQSTPIQTSIKPSFDLGQWFDKNKKSVFVGLGGIATLLILFAAAKFVFNLDFNKKESFQTTETDAQQHLHSAKSENQTTTYEENTSTSKSAIGARYISHSPCTFNVKLPSSFKLEAMSDNNSSDYCDYSARTKDGFAIIQLHSLLSSRFQSNSIKELYDAAIEKSELDITYKTRKDNWFVISGIKGENGNIVYWKRVLGNNFISDLHIEYPKNHQSEIEPYIATISSSFTSN